MTQPNIQYQYLRRSVQKLVRSSKERCGCVLVMSSVHIIDHVLEKI